MLNKHNRKTLPKTCRNRITGRLPCNVGRAIRLPLMSGFADAHFKLHAITKRLMRNSYLLSVNNYDILYAGRSTASTPDLYEFRNE